VATDGPDNFGCAKAHLNTKTDVEGFVRGALEWLADPGGVDREVLVLDDDGEIAGVLVNEDDDGDRFINALAIRADRQGEGLGRLILRTLLDDLSARFPGRVARVRRRSPGRARSWRAGK